MVRLLRQAPGGFTQLLEAVDKFSKWIEARPIVNVRSEEAVSFFTDIIYRFGIPNTIITDNGTQFTGKKFLNFCDNKHIRVDWSAVAHPKTNGQVERANGMIMQGLKLRIFNRLNKFEQDGQLSCRPCCGAYAPPHVEPRGSRLSSWYMAPRRPCPRTSNTAAREYGLTPRKEIKSRSRTRLINSTRHAM
jgi:transposase InsO family protein